MLMMPSSSIFPRVKRLREDQLREEKQDKTDTFILQLENKVKVKITVEFFSVWTRHKNKYIYKRVKTPNEQYI